MKKVLVIVFVVLFISVCNSKIVEKSLSVTVLEESINGMRFAHRSDIIDGNIKDIWAVNGHSVSYDDYLEALLDAEREEMRTLRNFQNEKRRHEAEFKCEAQKNTFKKLIRIKIQEIFDELAKVKEPLLEHYLLFDVQTIASSEDLQKISILVNEAEKKCKEGKESSCSVLKECLSSLEEIPGRLHKLYQDSISHAIKTCNDTRSLKDLLSLIS